MLKEERRERGKRYADPREERYVKSYKEPKEIKHVYKPEHKNPTMLSLVPCYPPDTKL